MNYLAIETSTEACSVALVHGDEVIERSEIAPADTPSWCCRWRTNCWQKPG